MKKMKKILFPTDFSKPANNAFSYALKLADDLDASISLLHISTISFIKLMSVSTEKRIAALKENADLIQKEMDLLLEQDTRGRIDGQNILYGSFIAAEIADEAKEGHYDLIVMGMKGAHGIQEKWLGSVTY